MKRPRNLPGGLFYHDGLKFQRLASSPGGGVGLYQLTSNQGKAWGVVSCFSFYGDPHPEVLFYCRGRRLYLHRHKNQEEATAHYTRLLPHDPRPAPPCRTVKRLHHPATKQELIGVGEVAEW